MITNYTGLNIMITNEYVYKEKKFNAVYKEIFRLLKIHIVYICFLFWIQSCILALLEHFIKLLL